MSFSLYIHIPFCHKKCWYCSFAVIPIEKLQEPAWMAKQYQEALLDNFTYRAEYLKSQYSIVDKPKLYTLYFGGWTPLLFGAKYLVEIIDDLRKAFDLTELQEISFEANPYPYEDTIQAFIELQTYCAEIPRVRFSFGIQSLHDDTLKIASRQTTFESTKQFTQDILTHKNTNTIVNYDFIAFGDKELWDEQKSWLEEIIKSKSIDSFSLYTLEIFPWSNRYHSIKDSLISYQAPWEHRIPFSTNEDTIMDQFSTIKSLFLAWGYQRYEISNYALSGKESLHNNVYWAMKPYVWIWLWAHGCLYNNMWKYQRIHCNVGRKKFIEQKGNWSYAFVDMDEKDDMIESFFLWLRTSNWVDDYTKFIPIFKDNHDELLQKLVDEGLIIVQDKILYLTDKGMDIHHQVCLYLMKEI